MPRGGAIGTTPSLGVAAVAPVVVVADGCRADAGDHEPATRTAGRRGGEHLDDVDDVVETIGPVDHRDDSAVSGVVESEADRLGPQGGRSGKGDDGERLVGRADTGHVHLLEGPDVEIRDDGKRGARYARGVWSADTVATGAEAADYGP